MVRADDKVQTALRAGATQITVVSLWMKKLDD